MFDALYREILLWGFEAGIKRRKTFRYWKGLERTQWLPPDEVQEIQSAALGRLLIHAYDTCPYYRDAWRAMGLDPRSVRSTEDLAPWPVIDRDVIAARRTDMRSRLHGIRLLHKSTGGSSGTPLHFDLDTGSDERRMGAWHRGYAWAGAAPGTRQLFLWSVPLAQQDKLKSLKDRLYQKLYRRAWLNSFQVSEENVAAHVARVNSYRPRVIVAYAHSLYALARSVEQRKLEVWSPRSIVTGAEKLYPFQREQIERVFRAPVFETYGSREFMLMGAECSRHEGFHLTAEQLLIEILDDDGRPTPEGEEGNVVVTDLCNYGMPFVRYANGDRAVAGWGKCSCGRGLPILREVVGRRSDMVHTPDGRHISGVFFPHLIKDFPAVRRFLVVQDAPDHVEVRLVIGGDWDVAQQTRLERAMTSILGPSVRLQVQQVQAIPLTLAGKHRVVLNLCGEAMTGSAEVCVGGAVG
jgi:phenylacetate-CoA ligase